MSFNKVLNRPLFRQQALKKGYLKPIHAQTGVMVGSPTTPPPFPALRKPPTFMERMSVSGPARFLRSTIGIPTVVGFDASGKVADAFGIDDPMGRLAVQSLGAYGATRALPALSASAIGLGPTAIGLGTIYGAKKLVDAGIAERKRINAMSPKEREEFEQEQRAKALGGEALEALENIDVRAGAIQPKKELKVRVKPKRGQPGSGRLSDKKSKSTLQAEGDELVNDEFASVDGATDINKIQNKALGFDEGDMQMPPTSDVLTATEEDEKNKKAEADKEKTKDKNKQPPPITSAITTGGDSFDQTIKLAKRYQAELDAGDRSQAKLVFLANLASGLLTGKTTQGGLAGALEVFGQALGPAVNNFATIKLKEGELRRNSREASLNAAIDHMKFLNDAQKVEDPAVDSYGIVQIRDVNGRLINKKGIRYKNGTAAIPAGLGPDGRERYVPIAQGGPIMSSGPDGIAGNEDDVVVGSFENFLPQKQISDKLFEIHDVLGNRYNALSVARDVLRTLNQVDAEGEKPKAGAALVVDSFIRRFTGVAKELALGKVTDEDFSNLTPQALKVKLDQLYNEEVAKIETADLTEEQRKAELELIDKERLLNKTKDRLKKRGLFSGLSRAEQERLAVQETTLVYALANTFKDQDRLTQRDIDAARNIVNIFSLTRSSADVRASIEAIAQQLEADIKRQEELYALSGGLETSVQQLRGLKNFTPFRQLPGGLQEQLMGDLTDEEIQKRLDALEL
tara:strand:+ start:1917 stop:4139 length:2223 start_codon:yes stop_codon:yes gene_type:complete